MFEFLYGEKMKFDWNTMDVSIRVDRDYKKLNLDKIAEKFGDRLNKEYMDWERTLDYLAFEYQTTSGYKFADCPVRDNNSKQHLENIFSKSDLRIEINMYIFLGIYKSLIRWNWGTNYFYKLDNLTLFKSWFNKGTKRNKEIERLSWT